MTPLHMTLADALQKSQDCSEAKHVAEFVRDILMDGGGPAQVAASMQTMIDWATTFMRAAERSQ